MFPCPISSQGEYNELGPLVLCWVLLLAKASHFACCLILLKSCHHKRMTTHVAFPAIMQLCHWIIGRCAQLAPPLSSGINSQTLVAGLCFWFVLALRPVITFIADTSWAPSVLSVRALSASNGILSLSHSTATKRASTGRKLFSHRPFLHFLIHAGGRKCVVQMRDACYLGVYFPCHSLYIRLFTSLPLLSTWLCPEIFESSFE